MNAPWRIELFGGLRAVQGERVITRFRSHKTGALLAYLAFYKDRAYPREVLIDLLWPDFEPQAARNYLSKALSSLRHQLESPGVPAGSVIQADRFTVRLNPEAIHTDVADFETALREGDSVRAVDLYGGPLLPGYYQDWIAPERERLAEAFVGALRQWTHRLVQAGDFSSARDYARRAVTLEPLREELHRDLMRLLAATGQRSAALGQYRRLKRLLKDELGITPSAATCALAREIETQESIRTSRPIVQPDTVPAVPAVELVPAPATQTPAYPSIRLPLQFTRFFGREPDIARLVALLSPPHLITSSPCEAEGVLGFSFPQLVTLTGPGGTGKTRLAIEAARYLAEAFPGGVYCVPLADLSDPRLIPSTVLDVLAVPRSPQQEPLEQVVTYLNRQAASLLLLDNMEHLLSEERRKAEDGAVVVRVLRERCPGLTLLITSRQRLDLEGEQEFPVLPLPVPDERRGAGSLSLPLPSPTPAQLLQCASVALFLDRAQAVRPDFQVTDRNAAAVAAMCDRLEGIPLAIELAAARIQVMTPSQMLAQLERRFDFLVSRRRDAIERHRTLHAAIEWSYRLLSPQLRRFFARLSVFRGGWTAEAAEAVCEEPMALEYLGQLRECSLVQAEESKDGKMRFRMLETIREYGDEQLSPDERTILGRRHLDFFVRFQPPGGRSYFADQLPEMDNVRAALAWCMKEENGAVEAGLRLMGHIDWDDSQRARRVGNNMHGWLSEARRWLDGLLAIDRTAPWTRSWGVARANAVHQAGVYAFGQGDFAASIPYLEESLTLHRQLGWCPVDALQCLGRSLRYLGDYERARTLLEEGVISSRQHEQDDLCDVLIELAVVVLHQGDYDRVEVLIHESLSSRQII